MRADRVDPAVAEAMRAAECQRIYFGVESGSDRILRAAKKGMTTAQIRRGIRAALDAGLRVKTGWIYGLPGSLEEQYESIPFMLDLRPHEISIHQLIPFPGTSLLHRPGALRHSHRGLRRPSRAFVTAGSTATSSSIISAMTNCGNCSKTRPRARGRRLRQQRPGRPGRGIHLYHAAFPQLHERLPARHGQSLAA